MYSHYFIEQSPHKSESWIDGIRLLVLEDQIKKFKPNKVIYNGKNKKINNCISKLCNNCIDYKWDISLLSKSIINASVILELIKPRWLKNLILYFLHVKKILSVKKIIDFKITNFDNKIFLLSYILFNSTESKLNEIYFSKYWGELPRLLNKMN